MKLVPYLHTRWSTYGHIRQEHNLNRQLSYFWCLYIILFLALFAKIFWKNSLQESQIKKLKNLCLVLKPNHDSGFLVFEVDKKSYDKELPIIIERCSMFIIYIKYGLQNRICILDSRFLNMDHER